MNTRGGRLVGEERMAVIAPYPARWLLSALAAHGVTGASVRTHAHELARLRTDESRRLAAQMLAAWRQIELAAIDGNPARPVHGVAWAAPDPPQDRTDPAPPDAPAVALVEPLECERQ